MAEDVLENHHGIIDQTRKGQSQAAEHHAIDGFVARMKQEKCGHHRKRDGEKHGRRGAWTSEKNQNHHCRKQQADSAFAQHCGDGLFHE